MLFNINVCLDNINTRFFLQRIKAIGFYMSELSPGLLLLLSMFIFSSKGNDNVLWQRQPSVYMMNNFVLYFVPWSMFNEWLCTFDVHISVTIKCTLFSWQNVQNLFYFFLSLKYWSFSNKNTWIYMYGVIYVYWTQ